MPNLFWHYQLSQVLMLFIFGNEIIKCSLSGLKIGIVTSWDKSTSRYKCAKIKSLNLVSSLPFTYRINNMSTKIKFCVINKRIPDVLCSLSDDIKVYALVGEGSRDVVKIKVHSFLNLFLVACPSLILETSSLLLSSERMF